MEKYEVELEEIIERVVKDSSEFYEMIYQKLPLNDRKLVISNLLNKNCDNCTNINCIATKENYSSSTCCSLWENPELIGKSRVLRKNNINDLK